MNDLVRGWPPAARCSSLAISHHHGYDHTDDPPSRVATTAAAITAQLNTAAWQIDVSNVAATDDSSPSERLLVRKHARHGVDVTSKYYILPPTLSELIRLVRKARASQLVAEAAPVKTTSRRSLRRKFSPEVIREIVKRYESGEFTTDLSREYGISKSGLLKLLREEGVNMRNQPMTPEQERQAIQLYESGMTITEIVERIGSSYGSVRTSLHRSGMAMRIKGQKRSRSK